MIKNIKQKILFSSNSIFNHFYQKIKYDNKFLFSVSSKEILKHEENFYEQQIKGRKQLEFSDSFDLKIDKLVLDNSISICDPINPLLLTAKEIILDPNVELEQTSLYKFFQTFNPKNLMEVFLLNSNKDYAKDFSRLSSLNQYTLFFPWFHKFPQRFLAPGMFGPKDISFPKLRFIRLKNLIFLLQKYNYVPSENDQICGYKLINENDYRFVITAGSHRSSVLKALNKKMYVAVKFDDIRINQNFFKIRIQDVKNWPGVSSGYISKKEAERMFLGFFEFKKI